MSEEHIPLDSSYIIRKAFIASGIVIALFVLGIFIAKLNSGTVVTGIVSPLGDKKIISHSEVGIIKDILVKEGDNVKAGTPLISLETIDYQTNLDLYLKQKEMISAKIERLKNEQLQKDFSPKKNDSQTNEYAVFKARQDLLNNEKTLSEERISQTKQEIQSQQADLESTKAMLIRAREQADALKQLYSERFVDKIKLNDANSKVDELEAKVNITQNTIQRLKDRQNELRSSFAGVKKEQTLNISQEYLKASQELKETEEKIELFQAKLAKKTINAPVDGVVNKIAYKTIGTAITPGMPLVEIVPNSAKLIIEAKINSDDINFIKLGTPCYIRFTAYKTRYYNAVHGKVIWLSADSTKELDNMNYYAARIEADEESMKAEGVTNISAGMRANVELVTGERTVARYLFDPVRMSLTKVMKER